MKKKLYKILSPIVIASLLIFFLPLETVFAVDTGFKNPTATGEDYNDWTNPSNAFSSNDSWATSPGGSDEQDYYNFSFGIPAGATIDGIEVRGEWQKDSAQQVTMGAELSWDGGVTYTTSGKTAEIVSGTVDELDTYGGATDTWGRTWNATEFSDANFRLKFKNFELLNRDALIDHVVVKVYYTSGATAIVPSSLVLNSQMKLEGQMIIE